MTPPRRHSHSSSSSVSGFATGIVRLRTLNSSRPNLTVLAKAPRSSRILDHSLRSVLIVSYWRRTSLTASVLTPSTCCSAVAFLVGALLAPVPRVVDFFVH